VDPEEHEGAESLSGLDRETALSRVGGDADLLKEIAIIFLDDSPKALAEIRSAISLGDHKVVERAAHGIKGAVANFGAGAAVDAALHLEQIGRAQDLKDAGQALATLERALEALRAELLTL